jgi:AcrR family transcriptional regulator
MAPEDRRKAIIAATLPLLREHGAAVTTKQVAEAAGIAEGTIFRVFPDKRALLLAAAHEVVSPEGAREAMAADLARVPRLEDKVTATVKHLLEMLDEAMAVMMALRPLLVEPGEAPRRPGPPQFVAESNRQLLQNLADLLFAPHADELRLEPARAAVVLRSLVFGTWHPGTEPAARLSPEEIADVCLRGVTHRSADPAKEATACC